ncbi:MAG: orc1/cdc6 family replication initiation protein [Nitrososphaeria archaeon]
MESTSVDDIFKRALTSTNIFKDRSVLRSDYVPDKLYFRDEQIRIIAETISPILHGARPSNIFLYGKTGTGKTAVAKYVFSKLSQTAISKSIFVKLSYVNTRMAGTEYRVLYEIARDFGITVPHTGLSISEIFDRIFKSVSKENFSGIITLDEIDFLVKNHGDDLLYELTRANEKLSSGFISLLGISNDLTFKDFLDPRVLSSLSEEELVFPPYTAEELKVILAERIKIGFQPNVFTDAALNLASALAASEHGDARRAVDLVRVAGEIAERNGLKKVDEQQIREALLKIDQDRLSDALKSLPLHSKLVVLSVASLKESLSTGAVYTNYSLFCKRLNLSELTPRRISGLLNELSMLGIISASTVSLGRQGRSKRPKLLIPFSTIKTVFLNDPILFDVLNMIESTG